MAQQLRSTALIFGLVACAECLLAPRWLVVRTESWLSPGNLLALSACLGIVLAVYDCVKVQMKESGVYCWHRSTWLQAVRARVCIAVFAHMYVPVVLLILFLALSCHLCICRPRTTGFAAVACQTLHALAWWTWLVLVLNAKGAGVVFATLCVHALRAHADSGLLRECLLKLVLLWGLSHWDDVYVHA